MNMLGKSGGLRLVLNSIDTLTQKVKQSEEEAEDVGSRGSPSSINDDNNRAVIYLALETVLTVARSHPASRKTLLEDMDAGAVLARVMQLNAHIDQEITSLAGTVLATLSEDSHTELSTNNARLCSSILDSLDGAHHDDLLNICLLYTSPSPRDS